MKRQPRIGIALGSGSARGWAHIGVLRALAREGVVPDIIAGCSIGALVGSVAAAGELERLEHWVRGLGWPQVMGLLDPGLRGGLIKGDKLIAFFQKNFVDRDFADLARPFGCVATDLQTGHEVWLREGSVSQAVRASIALPGLMTPQVQDERILVDGALVNPVPVSLCRAMGADIVLAVELNSDMVGRAWRQSALVAPAPSWSGRLRKHLGLKGGAETAQLESSPGAPSMLEVINSSISIMSVRIARSRLAGEPADVLISPRLAQLGLMDYHRGPEAMAEGEAAVALALPAIRHALGPCSV